MYAVTSMKNNIVSVYYTGSYQQCDDFIIKFEDKILTRETENILLEIQRSLRLTHPNDPTFKDLITGVRFAEILSEKTPNFNITLIESQIST